jgi:hypothetical protein
VSFSSGLTFVALSQVKALDGIIIVGQVDYSSVQKLANTARSEQLYTVNGGP